MQGIKPPTLQDLVGMGENAQKAAGTEELSMWWLYNNHHPQCQETLSFYCFVEDTSRSIFTQWDWGQQANGAFDIKVAVGV